MALYALHIKNMVCPRCIKVVGEELQRLNQPVAEVKLGEALLSQEPSDKARKEIKEALAANGFEVLEDKKAEVIEQVKRAVIALIRTGQVEHLQTNISDYLSEVTGKEYTYLSSAFSTEEGTTIARFVMLQKVERIKELVTYNELTLSQIAYQLGYSSVAHLSNQFKQVTGLTPSEYKKSASHPRKPLDQVLDK
ncbi:AraC family transcriptional regulator [Pontibacter sp. SGAir0037]|uniref:AraC family transcriptional regulator n=1 Tax=Pontibacter sp. SGAir0037 TaxID=2571030 RepID=UPI0010CD230D|nr:AraC family transcriptional regulator [Pontibacter sp. SGAir0037]QCR22839.1 AraC family transcriptional regulator [Pontibacter sp. SGAir0037]